MSGNKIMQNFAAGLEKKLCF